MLFMFSVTLLALVQLVLHERFNVIGTIAAFLFVLALVLIFEAARAFRGDVVPDVPAREGRAPGLEGGKVC
jgi:hypothetical protein